MPTTAELLEALSETVKDPENVLFSSPEMTRALNDTQKDIARRTGWIEDQAELDLDDGKTPANAYYLLPTDLIDLERLETANGPLETINMSYLPWDWTNETGEPCHYIIRRPLSVRVYPAPTSAITVTAYFTRQPSDLADNDPEIPSIYHDALVYGAAARLLAMSGEPQDVQMSQYWKGEYEGAMQQVQAHVPTPPSFVPYRHL